MDGEMDDLLMFPKYIYIYIRVYRNPYMCIFICFNYIILYYLIMLYFIILHILYYDFVFNYIIFIILY